jgi:hypothetical protein
MQRHYETRSRIGVGLYSLAEAARLIGAPLNTVRRWANPHEGLVPPYFEPAEQTVTFVELMELQFIKMFRSEGVSLQTIRRASEVAAKKFGAEYPFSVKRFDTDGRTVFATLVDEHRDEAIVEDLRKGQLVFEEILRPFFKKLEYRGTHEVARFWPLDPSGRIVLDPLRKFGKSIDAETGVATQAIYAAVTAGEGQHPTAVAKWLGIPVAAVKAAVSFEESLAA